LLCARWYESMRSGPQFVHHLHSRLERFNLAYGSGIGHACGLRPSNTHRAVCRRLGIARPIRREPEKRSFLSRRRFRGGGSILAAAIGTPLHRRPLLRPHGVAVPCVRLWAVRSGLVGRNSKNPAIFLLHLSRRRMRSGTLTAAVQFSSCQMHRTAQPDGRPTIRWASCSARGPTETRARSNG